jgi:peptide/nickel transport system substrate-binding protein
MKRVLFLALMLLVLVSPLAVLAQGPGEGGVVIEGSTRTSANLTTFNPIRCSGVDCSNVFQMLYPTLTGVAPDTQVVTPGVANTLATDWTVSDDGLVYTFTLRDDMTWNDGTPITAQDVIFTWMAMEQGETVGLSGSYASYPRDIANIEVVDDTHIAVTFESPNCLAIARTAWGILPAHVYGYTGQEDFDWASLVEHSENLNPTVTSGPMQFNRVEPGTAIYLESDQNYADALGEGVMLEGYVFLDTLEEPVMVERFLAGNDGDPNVLREPSGATLPTLQGALEAGEIQMANLPGTIWHYVALNLADPTNPQNGLDEAGNPVDQGHHPIFGDVRVRQALQHAINIDEIINGPLNGNATAMAAGTIPTAFTFNPDLAPRPFDLDAARALLDEAGWPAVGDPLVDGGDGARECQGCMYAEEGTPFFFSLMNVGDIRNDVSVVLQDQFAQIGVEVEVQVLDFNTMYVDNMGAQVYDAAVAGWRGGIPFDPDQNIFKAEQDIYGEAYGFNFPSYYNAEIEALFDGVNAVPGCDEATRVEMAQRAQDILWEEQPYLFLYTLNSIYAADTAIANYAPYTSAPNWNVDTWIVQQ